MTSASPAPAAVDARPRAATGLTRSRNRTAAAELPLTDRQAFADATRGWLGALEPPTIHDADGGVVWDLTAYAFLDGKVPDTVHPSLWRIAGLNRHHGLFKVADRIYQVRGYDVANMTVIVGATGFIVIDPLTCTESAEAALALAREHLGDRPVTAVIYTHSHADHFGGARGVVDVEDVRTGQVPVVAPAGFFEHAVSENMFAGAAMNRRASYMFGSGLPAGPRGHVTAGLGVAVATGTSSIIEPTRTITATGTELELDGVRFVFQLTPGAEAPAEVNVHLPDLRALCMAETVSQLMHNLYTLRGSQVRDALAWSDYLQEAIELFGDFSDVLFISHHWPVWGRERVVELIGMHRDLYRYIHDETLRLANHGHTPVEIAELIELPPQLAGYWANRGCYGSLNHNVKAVYQHYLGWFDGNPANLHPIPPAEAGRRYVELMGGLDTVLDRAREVVDAGEYRWAAELVKHALAAEPQHRQTRELQAEVFEQLGYQAESAAWRNFYLVGASELRHGTPGQLALIPTASPDLLAGLDTSAVVNYLAIRLHGPRASRVHLRVDVQVTDTGERLALVVERGLLRAGSAAPGPAGVTLAVTRTGLAALALGAPLDGLLDSGQARVSGERPVLEELLGLLDTFTGRFEMVTPNPLPRR